MSDKDGQVSNNFVAVGNTALATRSAALIRRGLALAKNFEEDLVTAHVNADVDTGRRAEGVSVGRSQELPKAKTEEPRQPVRKPLEPLSDEQWHHVVSEVDRTLNEDALRRITKGSKQISGGYDVAGQLTDILKVGNYEFEHDFIDFQRWSDRVADFLGSWVSPHLRYAWSLMPDIAREKADLKAKVTIDTAFEQERQFWSRWTKVFMDMEYERAYPDSGDE